METVREYVWASPGKTMTLRELARKYRIPYEVIRRAFVRWVIDWLDRSPKEFKKPNGRYVVPATFEDWLLSSWERTPYGLAKRLGISPSTVYDRFFRWCEERDLDPEDFRKSVWTGNRVACTYVLPQEFIRELEEEVKKARVAKERLKRALEIVRRCRGDVSEKALYNFVMRRFWWWCEVNGYVPEKVMGIYYYPEEFIRWLDKKGC